jgi:hypothetical protein
MKDHPGAGTYRAGTGSGFDRYGTVRFEVQSSQSGIRSEGQTTNDNLDG